LVRLNPIVVHVLVSSPLFFCVMGQIIVNVFN